MAELLFILVTIYVAYVVFVVVDCERKKNSAKDNKPTAQAAKAQASASTQSVPSPIPAKAQPTPAPVKKPALAKASPTSLPADTIKNPETGEVVKIASNYRFIKRWIKEALVKEGLLDKIYKNTELDKAALAKIEKALDKLKAMPKYQ